MVSDFVREILRATNNTESTDYFWTSTSTEVIDQWAGFDHRASSGSLRLRTPPSWVKDPADRRRIIAYRVAKAAQETVLRFFHDNDGPFSDFEQLREHGHVASFIERLADAIIGEDISLRVVGADDELSAIVPLPQKPDEPASDALPVEKEAYETNLKVYEENARRALEEWTEHNEVHHQQTDLQKWFKSWAKEARFWEAVLELETESTAPLGDGVVVLEIDAKRRPIVRVFAPDGFFKPDDAYTTSHEFPDRVHIAWEYERPEDPFAPTGRMLRILRRITWELMPNGDPETGQVVEWTPRYAEEPTSVRCFFTDAEWDLEQTLASGEVLGDLDVDEMPLSMASFNIQQHPLDPDQGLVEANRLPLPVDFIPVIHFRHGGNEKWGRSALARTMGLFDDFALADTSAALLSVLIGEPPLAVSGQVDEDMALGPAVAIDVGPDGKATKLGFADEMRAQIEYLGHLERQIIKMTSLSSELSGRENREQSGRAIGLKMTPFRQTVLRARQSRSAHYELLLKFVQRLALTVGTEGFPNEVVWDSNMRWGTFIPEDLSERVEQIILLRDRGILTDEDVYNLLVEAGMSVVDVDASLDQLRANDVKVAVPLGQILGPKAAADHLGREFDPDDLPISAAHATGPKPPQATGAADKPPRERSAPAPNP